MGRSWNPDWQETLIEYLETVTGPIRPEYLQNDDGCVMFEQREGAPNCAGFIDGSSISRFDFALYVRCNGRGRADRKRATDLLYAAANLCEQGSPIENSYITVTRFPSLFNRNMSGNEEYRALFSLYCKVPTEAEA